MMTYLNQWRKAFSILCVLVFAYPALAAVEPTVGSDTESIVPAPFRGDTPGSTLSIRYDDWSLMLEHIVLETGHSDRSSVSKAQPMSGSKIFRGGGGSSGIEGNRVDFYALMGSNTKVLDGLRDDLAKVPSVLPLKSLNRDEQLAYWLNLYNVTMVGQIMEVFPESSLKKFYFTDDADKALWDEKVVTVAGIPLSLNDIHHKILIPKFHDPLIMYGLFQGVIGGPNLRAEAYQGASVWYQLKKNAREFVNSNRGALVRERILRTSVFYQVNAALFPDFDRDMRAHLLEYASPTFAEKIETGSTVVGTGQRNWFIADLYGGHRARSSANTNSAALLGAIRTGGGAGAAGDAGGGAGGAIESPWVASLESQSFKASRFPVHTMEFLERLKKRNRENRDGQVDVEEYDDEEAETGPTS